jgi:hypothetical protein
MSNLGQDLADISGPIFEEKEQQTASENAALLEWASTTGVTCCGIIVGYLENRASIITQQMESDPTYVYNHLMIDHVITDSAITVSDKIFLDELFDNPQREYDVAEQIEKHYFDLNGNDKLHFPRITYKSDPKLIVTISQYN